MSDIAGPPAPKDIQPSVRGTDKASHVTRDPDNSQNARARDHSQDQGAKDQGDALKSRDPAVSIAASTAHLKPGQELAERVERVDAEGRPIIVTETVTLALKPDAGLKPNDEILLKIVDTGKLTSADLLRHNTLNIDPPTRLSVTIVEIHTAAPNEPHFTVGATLDSVPYSAPVSPGATVQPNPILPATAQITTAQPGQPTQTSLTASVNEVVQGTPATGVGPKASSADLATLIQQQQGSGRTSPQIQNTVGGQALLPTAVAGPGLGSAINAITPNGAPAIIQLLNPAISAVAPKDIATVLSVQPTGSQELRSVPVGAMAFTTTGGTVPELVRVDTNRGAFFMPAADAKGLNGEPVRVSIGAAPPQSQHTPIPSAAHTTSALFVGNINGAVPTRVDVLMAATQEQEETAALNTAVIKSVQTVAAFLSPDGPKADLRLQTDKGDISLTLPSSEKPAVGGKIHIISQQAQEAARTGLTPPTGKEAAMPEALLQAAAPHNAAAAATVPGMLANWPALEESVAMLAGTNAAAAGQLVQKSAQGGGKLANSLLFLLAAAGRGGPSAWVGKDVEQSLSKASTSVLTRLKSDIQQMAALASDTTGEWRTMLLPFDARGGEFPLAALLLHQGAKIDPDAEGENEDAEGEQENTQRFLLQVQFSILGDIQLDGTVGGQNFDLIVRSTQAFPQVLTKDATELFNMSLAANNFSGSIQFREQAEFPVDAAAFAEQQLLAQSGAQ